MNKTAYHHKFSSFSTIISFVVLAIIGIFCFPAMDLQLKPSKSLPRLGIYFKWPGASAKAIEQEVTAPMEGFLSGISGLKEIRSFSSKGYGQVSLSFKKDKNLDVARFEASMLIRELYPQLPTTVTYPEISLNILGESSSPILTYSLTGDQSPARMRQWLDKNVTSNLSQLSDVQKVDIHGAQPWQLEVIYQTDLLNKLKIDVKDLESSIRSYIQRYPVGIHQFVRNTSPQTLEVVMQAAIGAKVELENIPIKKNGSRVLFLKDVATIIKTESPPNEYYRINGNNTLNISIHKNSQANTLTVSRLVKSEMARYAKTLPANYKLQKTKDSSTHLLKELRRLGLRALLSLVFLLILTFFFYRKFKFISALLISLFTNLMIALLAYYLFEVEIHLYSLAGITISFGIILDNSILMLDAVLMKRPLKTFRSLLSATLTTLGAIIIIFLLEEYQKINLIDFAKVIIINLSLSLIISYYLIPALADKINFSNSTNRSIPFSRRKKAATISAFYQGFSRYIVKMKWLLVVVLILGFGIPVDLLPEKLETDHFLAQPYNQVLDNETFRNKIKPKLSLILGGTFRLFTEEVFENSYESGTGQRMKLLVKAEMEQGSTLKQLNETVIQMETFLKKFEEVELFETTISNYNDASISIFIKPDHEQTMTPFFVKRKIEEKALQLGGASWLVTGVGKAFSNNQDLEFWNSTILLKGYNYDQLYAYAQLLADEIKTNNRIEKVNIMGGFGWFQRPENEFHLTISSDQQYEKVSANDIYEGLLTKTSSKEVGSARDLSQVIPIILKSDKVETFNLWDIHNEPIFLKDHLWKTGSSLSLEKRKTGNDIYKSNQEYQIVVGYDYMGPPMLINKWQGRYIQYMKDLLPIGFSAINREDSWKKENPLQYLYIGLVVLLIFIVCTISLESIKQSLVILMLIPLSFIGIFLTFYLFEINFDQGGYASFLLTGGLSVNAGLYIINDLNQLKNSQASYSYIAFKKAISQKITPITITILSTICGLIPFLIQGKGEPFWYSFAAGSIGGLLFSMIGILLYLPAFLITSEKRIVSR